MAPTIKKFTFIRCDIREVSKGAKLMLTSILCRIIYIFSLARWSALNSSLNSVSTVKLKSLYKCPSKIYFISEILCLCNHVMVGSLSFNSYLNAIYHISSLRFIEFTGSRVTYLQPVSLFTPSIRSICTHVCIILCFNSCPIYLISCWRYKFYNRLSSLYFLMISGDLLYPLIYFLHFSICFSKNLIL